jgi:hypothetical protein
MGIKTCGKLCAASNHQRAITSGLKCARTVFDIGEASFEFSPHLFND